MALSLVISIPTIAIAIVIALYLSRDNSEKITVTLH
jgi:hypothetical protein